MSTNRRNVAKGALWAMPAVVATSQIPVYAASQLKPTFASSTTFTLGTALSSTCGGKQQFKLSQVLNSSFITVTNIPTGSTLSNLYSLFYLQVDAGTTFTRVSGSSTCWSVPVATGNTMVYNGVTLREYRSNYSCAYTISGGTWTQPTANNFNFISSCQSTNLASRYYAYNQFVTLTSKTGTAQTLSKYATQPTPRSLAAA